LDWTTSGNDAQRSSWLRSDAKISTASVKDFQLAWKLKLNNEPRQLNALTPPVLLDFYIGYRGFRSLAFLAGSSGKVLVIDTDLARMEWEKSFDSGSPRGATLDCPGGMTANLTRPTAAGLPPVIGSGGFGRRTPAKSGVGEPHEGAITLAEAGRSQFRPPSGAGASPRVRPPSNPFVPAPSYVYGLSGDGMFHTMFVSNGEYGMPPVKFLAPNANAKGLIVVDKVAYVATTNGCGGIDNGIWALDLESKKVVNWKSSSGGVAGMAGAAFGPEGTLYVATGEIPGSPASASYSVVALEPKTLKQIGSYTASQSFTSSPIVVDYKDKDLLAVAAKDGTIHLLDGTNLGGADHRTAIHKTPAYSSATDFVPGALATWRDSSGVNWVLAPAGGPLASGVKFPVANGEVTNGAILAWKVVDKNGAPALEPAWASRDMVSPLPPIVVNGVVFAAASGEFRGGDRSMTAEQRAQRSSPAILYALDGATGKLLWDSGDAVTSFAPRNGLSSGGGKVYLSTYDSTLYAFGFPIEH
jgi:hypothetical protein